MGREGLIWPETTDHSATQWAREQMEAWPTVAAAGVLLHRGPDGP